MLKEVMVHCRLTFRQVLVNFFQIVLVVDTLMRQQELTFSILDLLHVYIVVHPKKELGTQFLKGNQYLQLRNPCHPQTRW